MAAPSERRSRRRTVEPVTGTGRYRRRRRQAPLQEERAAWTHREASVASRASPRPNRAIALGVCALRAAYVLRLREPTRLILVREEEIDDGEQLEELVPVPRGPSGGRPTRIEERRSAGPAERSSSIVQPRLLARDSRDIEVSAEQDEGEQRAHRTEPWRARSREAAERDQERAIPREVPRTRWRPRSRMTARRPRRRSGSKPLGADRGGARRGHGAAGRGPSQAGGAPSACERGRGDRGAIHPRRRWTRRDATPLPEAAAR